MILHAELVPGRIQYRLLVYSCVWNCDIYPTRSTRCVSPVERTQLCPYHSSTYRYLSSTKFRIDLNLVRPKFRLEFSMILISVSYPIIAWLWLPPGASVTRHPMISVLRACSSDLGVVTMSESRITRNWRFNNRLVTTAI